MTATTTMTAAPAPSTMTTTMTTSAALSPVAVQLLWARGSAAVCGFP
jgi:hypothetical protein